LELHISTRAINGYKTSDQDGQVPNSGGMFMDRIIAHELTHATMASTVNMGKLTNSTWFVEGVAEAVNGADDRVVSDNAANSIAQLVNFATDGWDNNGTANASAEYSGAYLAVRYMNEAYASSNTAHDGVKRILANLAANKNNTSYTFNSALAAAAGTAGVGTAANGNAQYQTEAGFLSEVNNQATTNTTAFLNTARINTGNADIGSLFGSDAGGAAPLNATDVVKETGTVQNAAPTGAADPVAGYTVNWNGAIRTGAEIQVGGKSNEVITVSGGDVTAKSLKIDKLNISTQQGAASALGTIDRAIDNVSTQRANLGAAQNRLEHTITATNNTSENLTASESKIRDTDMAKEMMNYTKNNILTQAAQSMLAQANQAPQAILSLLG